MKLITFLVPCYNSQDYMQKCIDSLLPAGEDAEIIIVDDGSKDNTAAIADGYAENYPAMVRLVHQPNGGHGSGINCGISLAQGLYFKVVDSDDWLDKDALLKLIQTIKSLDSKPDLIVTNFIYDKVSDGTKYISRYRKNFKQGYNDWAKVKPFKLWHMMLMHALLYKTDVLVNCGISLPEHTFYEDNFFAYMPLAYTRNLYYLDVDLYHYFIGREDQSVNIKNIVNRYGSQLRVMNCMINAFSYEYLCSQPKGLKKYLKHSLNAIMANTLYFTCGKDEAERRSGLKEMWQNVKVNDKKMYKFLRYRTYAAILMPLPWKLRGAVAGFFYKMLCKVVKLG
ncbi:MAG: glycosyltransferase [Clostridia bacterium]|nr:glycosyltransferase [Clostridia bacterium]